MQVARRRFDTWAPTPVRRLDAFDAERQLHRAVSMGSAVTEDAAFVEESARARELAADQLRLLCGSGSPDAHLDCVEPSAPLAPFAVIRSPDGETLAQVSAHAAAAKVLIGEQWALCAFHDPTAEERAHHVYGAVRRRPGAAHGRRLTFAHSVPTRTSDLIARRSSIAAYASAMPSRSVS
jgi:hypothetical protein